MGEDCYWVLCWVPVIVLSNSFEMVVVFLFDEVMETDKALWNDFRCQICLFPCRNFMFLMVMVLVLWVHVVFE